MLLALLVLHVSIAVPFAQSVAVPTKIQIYLNMTYPGWKQTGVATNCILKFRQSVVAGDFDGDGRRDYAVKFTHHQKGYIVAFLARGTDYQPYILIDRPARGIRNIGLSIGHRGQRDENEEGGVSVLGNDAPLIGACASEACYYVYRNGGFHCE
jgi:hypothetical protein